MENPTIVVTSPTSKDNQVEIITSQNVRRRKRWSKRPRGSLVVDEITNSIPEQELSVCIMEYHLIVQGVCFPQTMQSFLLSVYF